VAFAIGGSLLALVWVASRTSRGKLQIVDGTCCPCCGYNLVGNKTYICSECGQPFTLEELDITAEDLEPVQ
jgi:predicted amidophosphoribosyltransferase